MTTKSIRSFAFAAITLFLGACGANPASFAQCQLDKDENGNALKTSKDCEGSTSCQQFDGGPGLQGFLCNDAQNPCASTSAAFLTCQAMGKTCQVITLTDGSKGAKCIAEDPICANNGGCPSDTVCTPDGKGGKLCNTMTPAGTCSKHTDCAATQYCNIPIGKCEADHTVGQTCSMGTPVNRTAEMCTTSRCNADLRCGCNTTADCSGGMVCDAGKFECVTPVACTSDGIGSCNWSNEFCASAQICETKHNPNEICSRPAMCKSNVCNADGRCGCNTTADCTNAGLTGFICDGSNRCVVDPGQANADYVKICMTCADPAGCRAYAFDNSPATFTSSPDFVAKGGETCVTLRYGVCSTLSIPLTSASYGPGSTSTKAYTLPADKRLPGVQLQVCDKATVTGDCFAGIERGAGYMFPAMVSAARIIGLGTNPLVAKGPQPYNLLTEVYVQKTTAPGMTSRDGNPYVSLGQLGCPQ